MFLKEYLDQVDPDKVAIQLLDDAILDVKRSGLAPHPTLITFATDREMFTPNDAIDFASARKVGVVMWFDREDMKKALEAHNVNKPD